MFRVFNVIYESFCKLNLFFRTFHFYNIYYINTTVSFRPRLRYDFVEDKQYKTRLICVYKRTRQFSFFSRNSVIFIEVFIMYKDRGTRKHRIMSPLAISSTDIISINLTSSHRNKVGICIVLRHPNTFHCYIDARHRRIVIY